MVDCVLLGRGIKIPFSSARDLRFASQQDAGHMAAPKMSRLLAFRGLVVMSFSRVVKKSTVLSVARREATRKSVQKLIETSGTACVCLHTIDGAVQWNVPLEQETIRWSPNWSSVLLPLGL